MATKKAETAADSVSPDVEYMEQNFDNAAQVNYLAQNGLGETVEGVAVEDARPDALPAEEIPPTTDDGKPVVVLETGETVTSTKNT